MASPSLMIAVEPIESGKAMYLPLAAAAAGQKPQVRVVLRLRITNNESKKVVVNNIRFSFPGSNVSAIDMQGIQFVLDPDGSAMPSDAQGAIEAGQTATWSNGRVDLDPDPDAENWHENMVYLNTPAPAKVLVSVFCNGFRSPATVTLDLAPYTSPTAEGAFLLPFAAGDLRDAEYVITSGWHWANGGAAGGQIFAHDIVIQGVDSNTKKLNELLPGKSGTKNEDYRIWDKPIRAVADGVVEAWFDGMDTNTVLGKFPEPTPSPVAGNNIWIRHGNVLVLYAHLIKGSIPSELMKKGAPVKAGQRLGLIGNSGNSTKPHTHIQCMRDSTSGPLRGMPFRNGWVLSVGSYNPPTKDHPWVRLNAEGVPKESVSIWPASTWPTFKIPAAGIARSGSWANSFWISPDRKSFEQKAQELFDKQGRRLVYVTTYVENGKVRWAGIARSGDWANSFWISSSRAAFEKKAQELFDKQGRRLIHVHTYMEGGQLWWVGIARSGNWANSFWISASRAAFEQKAQELFDKQERRLVHVHTYLEGSQRRWIGIARSGNWANSFWISPNRAAFEQKAQELFDKQGRRLVHVHTYPEGNQRRWVGIARSGDWANSFWISADLDSFTRKAQDLFDDHGRRLTVVEFLAD